MLRFSNTQVFGLEDSIVASGYSFRSAPRIIPGREAKEKDWDRARKLGSADPGMGHDGWLKGVIVQADVTYPQYWTKQAQRYHWFEYICSTSNMHMLVKNASLPFEEFKKQFNQYVDDDLIQRTQDYANQFNNCDDPVKRYQLFMKLQSNLPMGFELTVRVTTNYLQLKTMYTQRKTHRLKEDWGAFAQWCDTLPHFNELTGIPKFEMLELKM